MSPYITYLPRRLLGWKGTELVGSSSVEEPANITDDAKQGKQKVIK